MHGGRAQNLVPSGLDLRRGLRFGIVDVMPELYPHQVTGVEWLRNRDRGLLFDEMGLGKTITAIAAADAAGVGRTLCIVPAVVLWNWKREWEKWSPGRRVQILDCGDTVLDGRADVAITTHGLLLKPMMRAQLLMYAWDLTILDEAHFFRGRNSQRTQVFYGKYGVDSVNALGNAIVDRSKRVWLLTGTPMPNNCSELWTHLWGLFPSSIPNEIGRPMSFKAFRSRYCVTKPTLYGIKVIRNKNVTELRDKVKGFSLRRLKKDVLDLPAVRYETVTLRPKVLPFELKRVEAMIAPKLLGIIREGMADDATPAQGYKMMKSETDFSRFRHLCGMAKAEPCAELLQMELEDGALRKVVVFAHHAAVVDVLVHALKDYNAVSITGETPAKMRDYRVELFQRDEHVRVMICNIVAGGTGITLTAASEVVFVELSPVPGENAQAADRVHRIGQEEKVRVRVLALAGSIDEDFTELLRRKTKMIREVLQ